VAALERSGYRITACRTDDGATITGAWFVDATGARRVVARTLRIGRREFGPRKVALWSQIERPLGFEGTTLHTDHHDYLEWVWEIPVCATRASVGVVMPAERLQAQRATGEPVADLLAQRITGLPGRGRAAPDWRTSVRARSYRCHVSDRVSGQNWIMVGEAAAFVDPLSSYGVTLAIRHTSEGAALIAAADGAGRDVLDHRAAAAFGRNLRRLAGALNTEIERVLYRPTVAAAFGPRAAADAYIGFAYLANSLYARLTPTSPAGSSGYRLLLGALRLWPRAWRVAARIRTGARRLAPSRSAAAAPASPAAPTAAGTAPRRRAAARSPRSVR
jgi:flavin-dependent dehydrogenase